ncbi:MAG: TonB-dependent receptor [Bacteroidota bacterium]
MQLNIPTFFKVFVSILLGLGLSNSALAQGTLSGTVTDSEGETLFGVNILVTSNSTGTISDFDGQYELPVPEGEQTVVFSYTGYTTYELKLNVRNGEVYTENVVLNSDALFLDEMVVTGTFSGRTQKESPVSITLLNAAQLQRLTANSQADILRTIPGITAEGGGGEVASNVFVRGMPSGGQYQFTPLQVDGLPVLSTFGLNSSAHDVYFRNDIGIRNLEFVRGGSSTLFGAGSVAGIINYSSVTGTATPDNKVQLEWAEGGRIKADFLSSGPLSENTFYAVSGFYRYDDGPLETGMATEGYQIRGNIKRLFNDGESSFTIYGQLINDQVQFYLPYPLANDDGQRERPIGNDGEEIFTLLTSQATDFSFDTPFGRFQSPIGDGVSTQGGYLMLDLKHSFGNDWRLSAKAKTASYEHFFNLFLDGDGVNNVPETQEDYLSSRMLPADAVLTYADDNSRLDEDDLLFQNRILDRERPMSEIVGEAVITKTAGRHNISIGTFFANTRADDNNWITNYVGDFRNAPRMVNINFMDMGGNPVSFATNGFISGSQTANRYHQSSKAAIFVGDEFKGDRFNFDVGLRWEQNTGTIVRETGVGSNTFERGEVQTSDVAVAVAGLYKVSQNTNLYANFSRGYFFPELRSIRFSAPGRPQSFETESIIQGEAGVKYGNKKLAFTAAVFYVNLNDRRSVDFVNDPNNPGDVIEEVFVQSTRTFGIETSLNYNLAKGLDFYGNFTFQDHEFTEVENNEDQVGNELRRQPNVMGLAGLSYERNNFDANISSNFLGSKFANDANTVELEGFNIVRLDLGYRFSLGLDESLRLGVSVFNLFDSAGVTEGSPRQGNAQTGSSEFFVGRPILPRRIFLRAAFDF